PRRRAVRRVLRERVAQPHRPAAGVVGRGSTDLAIYEIGSVTRPTGPLSSSPLPPPGRLPEPVDLEAVRAAVPPQPLRLAAVLVGEAVPAGPGTEARAYDAADAVALVRDV